MGRLSEEECLLRQAKNRSSINLNNQGNLPRRFSEKGHVPETYKKEGNSKKISKGKLLPPYQIHYSYFSGRIYVEKTPEQCCLGNHNSQKVKGLSDRTNTQVAT